MTEPATPGETPSGARPTAGAGAASAASSPRRERMLSELAAELRAARAEHRVDVEQLRTDLTGLSTLLGENADVLAGVLPRVLGLDADLADLADRVDALASAVAAADNTDAQAPQLVDWASLAAEDAAKEWEALGEWVATVLGPFYEITRAQLPDCWALHRPAVIELVWLRRAYVAAHSADAAPSARADWHTRWRRDALANITAAIDEQWCRPGEHYINKSDSDRSLQRRLRDPDEPRRPMQHVRGQRPTMANDDLARADDELVSPHYWGAMYQHARDADLHWRRQREAADPPPTSD